MSSHENRDQAASWTRRLRAQQRGGGPVSRDLSSALALLGGLALLSFVASDCWIGLEQCARGQWHWSEPAMSSPSDMLGRAVGSIAQPLAYFAGGMFLLTFGVGWVQTGCGFFWNRLQFDLGRISPVRNMQRVRSPGQLAGSALGLIRWLVVITALGTFIWQARDSILAAGSLGPDRWLVGTAGAVFALAIKLIAVLGLLALVDYGLQWRNYERHIAMTPEEVREELRAARIDPQVTRQRRTLGRAFVHEGIIRCVRTSDLIVTDDSGAVIGIAWLKHENQPPRIALRAGAAQAGSIKQIAGRLGIPLTHHSIASQLFARCRLDGDVPDELIGVVHALERRI